MYTIHHPSPSRKPRTLVPVLTPQPASLSEAPCSLNTFVESPTLGRIQVTGRGNTPAEAVANLQGQVEALRPTPPPVLTREERLAKLLACGLQKATAKGDWSMVEKLTKAAALVLSGAVQLGEREGLLTVRSMSNPETWYSYEAGHCSCGDYTKRAKEGETYYCTHKIACLLTTKLAE